MKCFRPLLSLGPHMPSLIAHRRSLKQVADGEAELLSWYVPFELLPRGCTMCSLRSRLHRSEAGRSILFVRDNRDNRRAPALPRDFIDPREVHGSTAVDVLSRFGPDSLTRVPTFSAELYTVDIENRPGVFKVDQRLSQDLLSVEEARKPLPLPCHLELVLKPLGGSAEPVRLGGANDSTDDTESVSSASNDSNSDFSSDEDATIPTESTAQSDWNLGSEAAALRSRFSPEPVRLVSPSATSSIQRPRR